MLKKLISLYLSIYLVLTGIIPVSVSYAQAKKEYTIAILNLDAKGVSQVEAEVLSEKLRSHVLQLINSKEYIAQKKADKYLVVEQTQVDKILEQFQIQNTGCVSDSCAIEFGKMLQVDRIVIGQIGFVGNTYLVSARIIDVESRKAIATADRQYKGSIDDVIGTVINEVGDQLFNITKKKSKKIWYIVGVALIAGGAGAAAMGGGGGGGKSVPLPLPPDRP
jgi:hypothetical protein